MVKTKNNSKGDLMKEKNVGPKKLLIILIALASGGAEHMIYELLKSIDRSKYTPEILCYGCRNGNSLESETEKLCKVSYVGINEKIRFNDIRRVFKAIKKIKPDVIHAHQGGVTFAIPFCFFHRKPLCITVHSRPDKAFSTLNNRMLKMMKFFLRIKVIAVSKENLLLVQKFYKLNDKKSGFINNGIDIDRFYKTEHERFTFINVARQDENKNQIAIIRATSEIIKTGGEVKLFLVGDGPCHEELKAEAIKLGISESVIFTGLVSDPSQYYALSDVYVQTSFREALPLSVLEAMAVGLPIIATDVGGLRDVVDKNGFLIKAGDDSALLSSMNKMMTASLAEYEFMAKESKTTVKNYSSVRMAEQYEQIYKELSNK